MFEIDCFFYDLYVHIKRTFFTKFIYCLVRLGGRHKSICAGHLFLLLFLLISPLNFSLANIQVK